MVKSSPLPVLTVLAVVLLILSAVSVSAVSSSSSSSSSSVPVSCYVSGTASACLSSLSSSKSTRKYPHGLFRLRGGAFLPSGSSSSLSWARKLWFGESDSDSDSDSESTATEGTGDNASRLLLVEVFANATVVKRATLHAERLAGRPQELSAALQRVPHSTLRDQFLAQFVALSGGISAASMDLSNHTASANSNSNSTNTESTHANEVVDGRRRCQWLDDQTALLLRGRAARVLHNNPSHAHIPSLRGVRLLIDSDTNSGSRGASDKIKSPREARRAIVRALAESLGADLVHLNARSVEKMRQKAIRRRGLNAKASKTQATDLTDAILVDLLLQELTERNRPVVLLLDGPETKEWLNQDRPLRELLTTTVDTADAKDESHNLQKRSPIFLVLADEPDYEHVHGGTTKSDDASKEGFSDFSGSRKNSDGVNEPFLSAPLPPNFFNPDGTPHAFPSPPSGNNPAGAASPPVPTIATLSRRFRVVRSDDGSIVVEPLADGLQATVAPMPGPPPPELMMRLSESMRQAIASQQPPNNNNGQPSMPFVSMPFQPPMMPNPFGMPGVPMGMGIMVPNTVGGVPGHWAALPLPDGMGMGMPFGGPGAGGRNSPMEGLPPFPMPPGLTAEQAQTFLTDPANRDALNTFSEALTRMVQKNPPPGLENAPEGAEVEVKVHLVQVPVPMFPNGNGMPVLPPQGQLKRKLPSAKGKQNNASSNVNATDESGIKDLSTPAAAAASDSNSAAPSGLSKLLRSLRRATTNTNEDNNNSNADDKEEVVDLDSDGSDTEDSIEAEDAETETDGFTKFAALFDGFGTTLVVRPPRDQALRGLWEGIALREEHHDTFTRNRALLSAVLSDASLVLQQSSKKDKKKNIDGHDNEATLENDAADALLSGALSDRPRGRTELRAVLDLALTLQAARADRIGLTNNRRNVNSNSNSSGIGGEQWHNGVVASWALDAALLVQQPTSSSLAAGLRTREALAALVTDKHEKALLANVLMPREIAVSYEMVGGLGDVKDLLRQCVSYPLKYPRLYSEGLAAEAVKGVLLFGPPGTGKTMLAKAVATEGDASFLSIDASSIENKWLGESEKNARAVFTLARRLAPCVVFIDEVDSLLSSREFGDDSSHGTLTSVKTTLMQEWDGLRTTKDRVVVIASTNRPFDLDEAVLRRLPRRVLVDLPDLRTREAILQVSLANNRLAPDVNLTAIATKLEGYSGSDIKEVCREAVVRVAHETARRLDRGDVTVGSLTADADSFSSSAEAEEALYQVGGALLRPVSMKDFQEAMKRLKASVAEHSRELQKVVEWNEKYGELKRQSNSAKTAKGSQLSIYI